MRTHIIVPEELVQSVDNLVGPRNRSKFFAEAAKERLIRTKRTILAKKLAGSLTDSVIPGWETSRAAAIWVHNSRKADDTRRKRSQ